MKNRQKCEAWLTKDGKSWSLSAIGTMKGYRQCRRYAVVGVKNEDREKPAQVRLCADCDYRSRTVERANTEGK